MAVAVIGAQWGDEGKGKIVDYYAEKADVVVRFGGGNNAGHTVVVEGKKFKLHFIPSGVIHKKRILMGNGMVVEPEALLSEIKELEKEGIKADLGLSVRAHVIFPFHMQVDGLQEKLKGKLAAGTTKKGIGPCYSDKAARFGLRVAEIIDENVLKERLDNIFPIWEKTMASYGEKLSEGKEEVFTKYKKYGSVLKKYACDVSAELEKAFGDDRKVLFEGAQGTLLDIDHGLYPYGTSSNTTIGGVFTGCGIGPKELKEIILVAKAYTTRVGEGPVPTELNDETGTKIREKGGEYGTTTGRPRRCGWFDVIALKYAKRINGATGLAITKLDVLGGLEKIKLCTSYDYEGRLIDMMPANVSAFEKCKPVYDEMNGWKDLSKSEWLEVVKKGAHALPEECAAYVQRISELVELPVYLLSVGAERNETLEIKPVW